MLERMRIFIHYGRKAECGNLSLYHFENRIDFGHLHTPAL